MLTDIINLIVPIAYAQAPEISLLVGIPGIDATNPDFNTYINALYTLSIAVAGLLAVIKIMVAGIKYMLSDVVTSKGEAKSDIQGALLGLLIVMSAVLILNQINPQLAETKLFLETAKSTPSGSGGGGSSTPATPCVPTPPTVCPGPT